jgi:hypothetical protein
MFLEDERFNSTVFSNDFIYLASIYGHIDIVDFLLNNTSLDPSSHSNSAITGASLHKLTIITELL